MLAPSDLSQSKQPQEHYDYDGITGGWLWLPWWVHISFSILAWPLCLWLLPTITFQNESIEIFLQKYRIQLALFLSLLMIVTAILSHVKALRIAERNQVIKSKSIKRSSVAVKENPKKKGQIKKSATPKTNTKSKKITKSKQSAKQMEMDL